MKKAVLPAFALLLLSSGCIALRPRAQTPTAAASIIANVPARSWGDNTCGAGALSEVLNHFGDPATEAQLIKTLDRGLHGGVVSVDLLLEARRRGFEAELLPGTPALLAKEIDAQHPAILMIRVINLPGRKSDYYHYVVVDGRDPSRNLFRLHFGDGTARWIELSSIDRNWAATSRAMLVVRNKSVNAATFEETLRHAVQLEESGDRAAAIIAYRDLLQRDPSSVLVWTNLGNALTAEKAFDQAEESYRHALSLQPSDRDALNNFAWLLLQENKLEEAEKQARAAVSSKGVDEYAAWQTLGDILLARGNCREAIDAQRSAFDAVPSSQPPLKAAVLLSMARAQRACGDANQANNTLDLAMQLGPDAETGKVILEERRH